MSNVTNLSSLIVLMAISVAQLHAGEDRPPRVLVDKGACPFEGCIYRTWTTKRTAITFSAPSRGSRRGPTIRAGTKVVAMTGEVHTVGGRFVVKQPHGRYKVGDELTVYTYIGEGYFKVWFGGRMYQESLGFSPYGGSAGTRCADPRYCWGELNSELQMVWWVKLKLPDGRIVWARGNENFSGSDG